MTERVEWFDKETGTRYIAEPFAGVWRFFARDIYEVVWSEVPASKNLYTALERALGVNPLASSDAAASQHASVFYSCFISFSTKDQKFAERFLADLRDNGVRCWFAPHDIRGGKKLHEQIDEAIRVYDRLLLILSDHSMNSEWVKTEIANARQREIKEKRQMLFAISLVPFEKISDWKAFDADTGKDSARGIREYYIPDFSNWQNPASYQQAFQRLLRDLKAGDEESRPA